ncbi:hypothetical protein AAEQ99_28675, partial [Pseudomonas aeruginosa]
MSNGGSVSTRKTTDGRKRAAKIEPAEDAGLIRDKILAGAEDVFAKYGLHGATTAMIAGAAGIS